MFLNNPEQVRAFFEQSTALKGGLNIRLTQQEDHLQLYLGLSIGGVIVVCILMLALVLIFSCIKRRRREAFDRIYNGETFTQNTELNNFDQNDSVLENTIGTSVNLEAMINSRLNHLKIHPTSASLLNKL